MVWIVVYGLACCYLALRARPVSLIAVAVAAGAAQGPLVTWTQSSLPALVDDIALAALMLLAGATALSRRSRVDVLALVLFWALVALCAVQLARSPELATGLRQARQVLMPMGLVLSGVVLRQVLDRRALARIAMAAASVTAVWMLVEAALGRPLLDPTVYHFVVNRAGPETLRDPAGSPTGPLPGAYFAHMGDRIVFRPGGPYLNAPVAGFVLALAAFAVRALETRRWVALALLAPVAAALAIAYTRAGMVLFVFILLAPWIWTRVGRATALVVAGVAATGLGLLFWHQGNTASHALGLLSGLQAGLSNPLGLGFGTAGYQAALAGEAIGSGSESLLGLYVAWLGWLAIGALAVVLYRLGRLVLASEDPDLLTWFSVGFLAMVAVSESASSMAGVAVHWLLLGIGLVAGRAAGGDTRLVVRAAGTERAPRPSPAQPPP